MPDYPNTKLSVGQQDPAFGGQPANRFGTPQHTFQDAQIRELQRQVIDMSWSGRDVLYLPIASGGAAGDGIIFDVNGQAIGGGPSYKNIASVTYSSTTTIIVGILLEPVSAGAMGRVHRGGGYIGPSVTGLGGTQSGKITIDTTTGRTRTQSGGETTYGYCDKNGNLHLLALGHP